jgi:hypothetical protein
MSAIGGLGGMGIDRIFLQCAKGADEALAQSARWHPRLPWLTFSCPACGQWGSIDLRTLDRHPGGAISGLIPSLSCRRCSPNAPFASLEMLTAERP